MRTLLTTLLLSTAAAADPSWEVLSDGPVRIQQRVWSSGVVELQVESELNAPFLAVEATVLDCQGSPRFMPYVAECRPLAPVAEDGNQLVYTRIAPPLVSNRDSIIKVLNDRAEGSFKQTWEAVAGAMPEVNGVYRLKINQGGWKGYQAGAKTRLIYRVAAEPGPGVPGFVMSAVNRAAMYDLFKAVEKEAQRRMK